MPIVKLSGEAADHGQLRSGDGCVDPTPENLRAVIAIGAPVSPFRNWKCGTDYVWPVLLFNGRPLERVGYVCRHQIEIGD